MVTNITAVETGNKFWVNVSVDGHGLAPRGPFASAEEAEATAARLAAFCRGLMRRPVNIGAAPTPMRRSRHG